MSIIFVLALLYIITKAKLMRAIFMIFGLEGKDYIQYDLVFVHR